MDSFDERFARLAGPMMRALERRRDRARSRAAMVRERYPDSEPHGDGSIECRRWEEMHLNYTQAYDHVFLALASVRCAGEALRRIMEDR